MDSQTPNDYKEYFLKKFTNSFQQFINKSFNFLNNSDVQNELTNIMNFYDKLNYVKIISKVCNADVIKRLIISIENSTASDLNIDVLFAAHPDKKWQIMPSLNIKKIFLNIDPINYNELCSLFNSMYVCAISYIKVIECIENSNNNDSDSFNPFNSIISSVKNENINLDIKTLYNDVKVKKYNIFELLIEQILKNNTYSDMFTNIESNNVMQAAGQLKDVLNNGNFTASDTSKNILGKMLNNITTEVINLSNEPKESLDGMNGIMKLQDIAQKVALGMSEQINEQQIGPLELWDSTFNLASSTINNPILNILGSQIRQHISDNIASKKSF